MQLVQEKSQQAFRRTYVFGEGNTDLVPVRIGPAESWAAISRLHYELGVIIVRIDDAASHQALTRVHATLSATNEGLLREQLRAEMRPVAQVAQVLRTKVPGIGNLKMPAPQLSVESLLKYGRTFVGLATTYQSVLVEHGLAGDCVERITRAILPLKASLDGRGAALAAQTAATKDLTDSTRQGLQLVRLMDAAITSALRDNPVKLREWKNASRVTQVSGPAGGSAQAPPLVSTPDIGGASTQQDSRAA